MFALSAVPVSAIAAQRNCSFAYSREIQETIVIPTLNTYLERDEYKNYNYEDPAIVEANEDSSLRPGTVALRLLQVRPLGRLQDFDQPTIVIVLDTCTGKVLRSYYDVAGASQLAPR